MRTIQFCSTLIMLILLVSCASNAKNPDIINLPTEHDTATNDGLRMNAYVEKKEFKLGEPMNVHTLIKNTSNKIKKFSVFSFSKTSEVRLHYMVLNENGEPNESFPSSMNIGLDVSEDRLIGVNYSLNPDASILFNKDIQALINKPGKYQLIVHLIAFTETGILTSNKVNIEVLE